MVAFNLVERGRALDSGALDPRHGLARTSACNLQEGRRLRSARPGNLDVESQNDPREDAYLAPAHVDHAGVVPGLGRKPGSSVAEPASKPAQRASGNDQGTRAGSRRRG